MQPNGDKCASGACNRVCEQLFLENYIVLRTDGTALLNFIIINISGRTVKGPIVLVSSLIGTFLLNETEIKSGETIKLNLFYQITGEDRASGHIISTSFLALGTYSNLKYSPGKRISPVINEKTEVSDPYIKGYIF